MDILLLRPVPSNERFGLGPFFRIEPLGMEYVGAALEGQGHRVALHDLRFSPPVERLMAAVRPTVVGIACMHALEIDDVRALVARIRRASPDVLVIVGGHAAAAYPAPFFDADVDAICLDDGERGVPALIDALAAGRSLDTVRGWLLKRGTAWHDTGRPDTAFELDQIPLPARHLVGASREHYACFHHRAAYLIETSRGCPFRCSFCSVWQLFDRSVRERSIDSVCRDFETTGDQIFIADDLFWHHPSRSLALAEALRARGLEKDWILVQSRVDLVARHPELLEAWRPLAREFDIFFGLEAATDAGLAKLAKDTTVDRTARALEVSRAFNYGITGNFVIDPDWVEADFERLWAFVEQYRLGRAGFTILTPLPGTAYFQESQDRIRAVSWSQFDMHHLLWEPRLGVERFFELYCETWRRSVINLKGEKKLRHWLAHAKPRHWMYLLNVLRRTQRMLQPAHYIHEHALRPQRAPLATMASLSTRSQRNATGVHV
jgi:radical SAM superfamily enzyme YgiQ (UPF0313 family)